MEDKEDVRKKFGHYGVLFDGAILIHPIRPWWCLLEIYTVIVQIIFLTEYYRFNKWLVIAEVGLGLLALLFTLKTTLTNPGVCPKPTPEVARENEAEVYRQRRTGRMAARKSIPNPNYHPIKAPTAPRFVDCYYCSRCQMFKPPSASHCYTCDCCVTHLDHHCPVFGGCVARGNIGWFYGMILFMPTYWIFVLIATSGSMFVDSNSPEFAKSFFEGASYTFYFVVAGFVGALVCPAFLSQFSCLDRVHTRRRQPQPRPESRFVQPRTLPHVAYPRQPLLPIVDPNSHKPEDVNCNELPVNKAEDNVNQNTQLQMPDTESEVSIELQEETV